MKTILSCGKFVLRSIVLVTAMSCLSMAAAEAPSALPPPPDFVSGSWSLVLLPDTQCYSDQFPGLFTLQTHWIAKNRDKYNIRYVLTLGDITDKNTDREWIRAREAMSELDGNVPYAIVVGNHDYTPHGNVGKGTSGAQKYFPVAKFRDWPTFGGVMQKDDITNSYHLFSAGGVDWIVLALEWAPRDKTVQWANEILAKYPKRTAILVTHAYLYDDSTRYDFAAKKDSQTWNPHSYATGAIVNDGEELWQKLVRKNNFAFTFNGHVCHVPDCTGFLSSKNDCGRTTHQMLVDYQARQLGGEGYLRILEFLPDGKTVHVKSYSPLYDKYLSDPGDQFSFKLR
jgi:hypothetical protein